MEQHMAKHHASVTVDAPVHQVYSMFSHFNDFPKFMSFVKEVTYIDNEKSHWVADVAGRHEWDAVNEDWIPDQQIGWRAYNGLRNAGRVVFQPSSTQQTHVDVYVNYDPPASFLGDIGEHMGVGRHFDDALQKDLNHFAEMVHQAPPGTLDPNSSSYLFHQDSAAARGSTTERQNATMDEPVSPGSEFARPENASTPVRGEYSGDYPAQSGSGMSSAGPLPSLGNVPPDRPVLDRDIINEPTGTAQPTGQAGAQTPSAEAGERGTDLPPEQIPLRDYPEGNQPQP